MKLQSNIRKFYFYSFFSMFVVHTPIFILYWKEYLSLTQVMILQVSYFVLGILLEMPSGVFADLYGRRNSLIVGRFFYLIAIIGFIAAPWLASKTGTFFLWFLVAEAFAGTGKAFDSGADTALIYDTLKKQKKEKYFKKIRGELFSLSLVAAAVASFVGGLIAVSGLEKPYYFTALFTMIALLVAFLFKEPQHFKKVGSRNYWQHQKESIFFTFSHKRIRWLSMYFSLVFSFCIIGLLFFQLFLKHIGVPIEHFSIIYPAIILFGALVSWKAYKIEGFLGERLTLYSMPLVLGLSFIAMYFFNFYWAFLLLFVIEGVFGLITPLLDHYVHEHVPSKQRASVMSIRNLFASISFVIFSPIIGYVGDLYSLTTSFLLTGILILGLGFLVMVFWRKNLVTCERFIK